jgi:hypothetical protein
MFTFVKSTVLSLGVLAIAFAAHAQSENVAALPPGASVVSPAAVAPSGPYPGPDPGKMWGTRESQTRAVERSPQYIGPKPGNMWGAEERQTRAVEPSPQYIGPKPH